MHHTATPDHARHDLTLIAAHAAGDFQATESAAVSTLLSTCTTCAELHRDLIAIAAATRALPRTATAPRDFQLGADQARRLRSGSWLRTLLRPFASAGSATRPFAAALTSAGVAGLLIAAFVPGLLGNATSTTTRDLAAGGARASLDLTPEAQGSTSGAPAAPGAAATDNSAAYVKAGDSGDGDSHVVAGAPASPEADAGGGRLEANSPATLASQGAPNLLVIGSVGLLLVGLAMFGLRIAARRLR